MKFLAKIAIIFIALGCSEAFALTIVGYLPSDASFRTSLSKDEWRKALKGDMEPLILPYWIGGNLMVSEWAGQWEIVFEEFPATLRNLVQKVLEDQEMWKMEDGQFSIEGPLFVFCANDFDLRKHTILNRYNPNVEIEMSLYEGGKRDAKRLAEYWKKKFPIPDDPPRQFGAVLPFNPKNSKLGHEYDGTLKPPGDYQVFVISNAYAVLHENLVGKEKKAKAKSYQLLHRKISTLRYSDGVWTPCTNPSTEQEQSPNPR